MTRRHMQEAVKIVRAMHQLENRDVAMFAFAELFVKFNPRFDKDKFVEACLVPKK